MNVQKRLLTLALLTSMTFGAASASAQSSTEQEAAQDDATHSEAGSEDEEASSSIDAHEDAEDPEIIEDIATVRVSARRIQPEFEADRSVAAIDRKELRHRQPASLGGALDEEPGAYMQATTRGSETVYVRGLVGPENLIVVDGVRFNQSTFRTGPNQYLATLSPSVMARVELLRGPGSVLYGSGAMGGVIEVFPDAIPTDGGDVSVGLHARTADLTRGLNLRGGWGSERFGAMVGTTMLSHDTLNVGSRGGEDLFLAAEIDGEMLASDYEQRFLQTGVRVADASGNTELELRYLRGAIEGAKRTDQLGIGQMRDIDNTDDLAWLKVRRRALGPIAELNAFGAYHRTDEQTARVSCAFAEDTTPSTEMLRRCAAFDSSLIASRRNLRDTVQTFGGGLNAVAYPLDTLRLIVGAEGYMDAVASTREDAPGNSFDFVEAARGTFADGSTYTTVGAFTHAEYSLLARARHELMLSGGARVEHTRAFAPEVNATLGDVEFDNTGLVGQLGINYIIASRYNLYANWSQGFRSPNLQETTVLGDTGNFFEVPNDALGPERSNTFELGLKTRAPYLGRLRLGAFASLIGDRITGVDGTYQGQSEIDGKQVRIRVNADRAYYYGLEAALRTDDVYGVSLFGNLALLDGAVESSSEDPTFEGGPLHGLFEGDRQWTTPRRLPPMQLLGGLSFSPLNALRADLYVQGAGAQTRLASGDRGDLRICEVAPGQLARDAGQECQGTPGWLTLNLRASYRPIDHLHLALALTNLTDQRYQHHGSGMLGAGRQAMLTATLGY